MTLQDPLKSDRIACFHVEATGIGQWHVEVPNGVELPTQCLGIWDTLGNFYVAFVPIYLDIATLAEEVFSGTRVKLPLHWIKKGTLPTESEATPLYCKARFLEPQPRQNKSENEHAH